MPVRVCLRKRQTKKRLNKAYKNKSHNVPNGMYNYERNQINVLIFKIRKYTGAKFWMSFFF